ncbi:MAG: hypothetical protein Q4D54_10295 [Eubacteriales bacterium]|nr:hypothetical protein [Lachnospiraceae bacterium]MDO5128115.1 hypothetical protein [Eubacteriales bacterium]
MGFKEKSKNIRAFIVLLAAMICWLLNIRYKRALLESLIILIIVIAVFYVISTIAIRLFEKISHMDNKTVLLDQPEKQEDEET